MWAIDAGLCGAVQHCHVFAVEFLAQKATCWHVPGGVYRQGICYTPPTATTTPMGAALPLTIATNGPDG